MKKIFFCIQIILLVVLFSLLVFGLVPAQYELYKTNKMINKNRDLLSECKESNNGLSLECEKYYDFKEEYFEWLINT